MDFATKEDVFEDIVTEAAPACPHCGVEMSIWEVPWFQFQDGLGWGTPYLFVCFNDECPLFVEGWKHMKENFGHTASYRCYCYPGTNQFEVMPVFSPMAAKGRIMDDEVRAKRKALKEKIKKGFSTLAICYVQKDTALVLNMLFDRSEPQKVRLKAAEMVGDIGNTGSLEPLLNNTFANQIIQKEVDRSIRKLHDRFSTRECPYCAEIIKKSAFICKHCGHRLDSEETGAHRPKPKS
jgi:hypothetical protein